MDNREKVIKGLECHLKELSIGKACNECTYWADNPCEINVIADAIAILKEQPDIVRCKDCEYVECEGVEGFLICGISGFPHHQEYYCADGERGETE